MGSHSYSTPTLTALPDFALSEYNAKVNDFKQCGGQMMTQLKYQVVIIQTTMV